ncbi:MAG TPA: 1,6-anhydro-N-acetylmuramyl-L-alanine amidase AmpD [Burkholderiales bacterium]|nr:1,6-anhydro-N-acetylmuramyl-L-alanine amidase AmpD [Burkholderiales bacterium]
MSGRGGRDGEGGWTLDSSGILPVARQVPSPNFDERPPGATIDLLVVHNISLPPGQFGGAGIEQLFTNRLDPLAHPYFRQIHGLRVSSHFLVRRGGELVQFVACGKRAWHAGQSEWRGRPRCNDFSVGVELEGCDDRPFEDAQYRCLADVAVALRRTYPILDCVGHSDIAMPPGRKSDPGPHFDWARFRALLADKPGAP